MTSPGDRLDRDAANALAAEMRESLTGTHLFPADEFWPRLGMPDPTQAEQEWLAHEFDVRGFEFTPVPLRDAVYIVWRGGPSPAASSARERTERQQLEADWRQEPDWEERWAAFGVPNSHRARQLRAISIPQPQAELVIQGRLDSLTRPWPAPFPFGGLLVHASKTWSKQQRLEMEAHGLERSDMTFGTVIGLVDVVAEAGHEPQYTWALAHPRRFAQPVALAGRKGVFMVDAAPFEQELWSKER